MDNRAKTNAAPEPGPRAARDERLTMASVSLHALAIAEESFVCFGVPASEDGIAARGGSFRAPCTQTRHLARIFTVDFHKGQALNSWHWVSNSATSFLRRSECARNRSSLRQGRTPQEIHMNKADLIDRIAAGCGISKTQAAGAIDTAVESITGALKKGDRVALIGFGTFSISQRKARNGRNPQTGATIKIAARRVAKFTAGAELKKAVNRGK